MTITITNKKKFIRFLKEYKFYNNFKKNIGFNFDEKNGVIIPIDFWWQILDAWCYWCLVLNKDNAE